MSKQSDEAKRQASFGHIPYSSKALRNECKENMCKRARQNGSSRCEWHSNKKDKRKLKAFLNLP